MVEVVVRLTDCLASQMGAEGEIPRQLLEAYAAEAYRTGKLSRFQVGQTLGLDRWQTEQFLADHQAQRPYSFEDWEVDRKSLAELDHE